MRSFFILLAAFLLAIPATPQNYPIDIEEMPRFVDSLFEKGVEDKLLPGGIIGIIHQGKVIHEGAYGLANVASKEPVVFEETIFQLGSVGKFITATAVLREVEKGRLDLHADVNDYLQDFKITSDFEPITLHHLLLHTAGLNDRILGYAARNADNIEPLGQHLKGRFPKPYAEPGSELSYSNYSFGLAGHLVELSSKRKFKDYVQEEILDPLGMNSTTYSQHLDPRFATGYQVREQYNPVNHLPRHVTPAGGISTTGSDYMKLIQALLAEDSTILKRESYSSLKASQFSPHRLLSGHSYGIEFQNFNGHIGIGKSGNIPGFLSYFIAFPHYDFGLFVAVNTQTDNFLESFTQSFKDRFFPRINSQKEKISLNDLSVFEGTYRANRYNRNTIEDLFGLIQGSTNIYKNDTSLFLFHNGGWQFYQPIGDHVFQNTSDASMYLVFEMENGVVQKMHRNVIIGGFMIPVTFEPTPWYRTVNFINEYAALFPFFNLTYLLFPLAWLIIMLIRKRKPQYFQGKGFKKSTRLIIILFSILTLINMLTFVQLFRLGNDLLFGVPDNIRLLQTFSFLIPVALIWLVYRLFKAWNSKEGLLISRIYLSLFTASAIIYTLILHNWHFIGLNF